MAANRYLDPQGLATMSRIELVARRAVDGFLAGFHPSPYHGSSIEYADHRPYVMGDEIRTIDWNLLAKTDKYYVKLFEDQTNCRGTILLDASRSMAFRSDEATMSKYDYGCHLAAALSYLMLRQKDAVGFAMFDAAMRHYLPASGKLRQFHLMLDIMERNQAEARTGISTALHELATRLRGRGMVILISDMLDDPERIKQALAHLKHRRHDVLVLHVVDPAEMMFPYTRPTRFQDMEGGGQVTTSGRSARARYLERFEAFLKETRTACLERGVAYELTCTDAPYDRVLRAYLEKRRRLK